jgi:HEAT repeat protein
MILIARSLAALALFTPVALGHGGQYVAPPDSGSAKSEKGGTVKPPTNPMGEAAGVPGQSGDRAATRVGTGVRTGKGRGVGRGGDRRGAVTGGGERAPAWDGWQFWWDANSAEFLSLRGRLASRGATSGVIPGLTGRGRFLRGKDGVRPDAAMVMDLIVPTLTSLLGERAGDIADSAVLALARVTDPEQDPDTLGALLPQLAHEELSVRSSTALALGVLGDARAAGALVDLTRDTSQGRQLVGGGQVSSLVRCFSALSLGMLGEASGVDCLVGLVRDGGPSDRELSVAAAMGLTQVPEGHPASAAVLAAARARLADRRTDPYVKTHLVTVLAKVGGAQVVDDLVAALEDRDADSLVRQSVALALGRVAELDDLAALELMHQVIEAERDALTRHLAILALGRIGGRDDHPAENAPVHDDIEAMLVREIAGKGKQSAHRSWAALSAALYARAGGDPDRGDRLAERLSIAYDDESDPAHRGAFAVALGLAGARSAGPLLVRDLRDTGDDGFRGHLAVALGLMGEREAVSDLMRLCTDSRTPSTLRRRAATGLGLLGERSAVASLVEVLDGASTLGESAGAAAALGLLGDRSAVDPLVGRALDDGAGALNRGFAAAALGLLAERGRLPFTADFLADAHYMARTDALAELMDLL